MCVGADDEQTLGSVFIDSSPVNRYVVFDVNFSVPSRFLM